MGTSFNAGICSHKSSNKMQCNSIKNLFCKTESTDYGMEDSGQELSLLTLQYRPPQNRIRDCLSAIESYCEA